jgi:hypothetical protein
VIVPPDVVAPAVELVLQNMYFCEALFCGKGVLTPEAVGAAVTFNGSLRGEFRIAVSDVLAARMTIDFLALDDGGAFASQIEATVRELANIACGAALSAWAPAANLHFSVPEGFSCGPAGAEFPCCFAVPGERAEIGIEIRLDE